MGASICSQGRQIDDDLFTIRPGVPRFDKEDFRHCRSYCDQHCDPDAPPLHLAPDRDHRPYESSAHIPDLFDVKEPTSRDPPNTYMVVHRETGAVRRLLAVCKPSGAERQERLRSVVRRLEALRNDGVVRILDVFEDCRAMSLVMETCSEKNVYERILQRQYFAEQESAVLVRHMLQSLAALHKAGLAHGHPNPDSFKFQSDQTHASLKLVDFGLDLKVQLWDAVGTMGSGPRSDGRRTRCIQFFETCRMVFCAPEVVRPLLGKHVGTLPLKLEGGAGAPASLDPHLLAVAVEAHLEHNEESKLQSSLEAADAWSIGAIAFLLLCGYPPFFAPCRHAILARVEKIDFSFDPPFWSKISEEAKDFVQRCLRGTPGRRLSVSEALKHTWIQSLADTSPSGSMLSSFALNLRRFFRTSLIEAYTANSLAAKMSIADARDLHARCAEADAGRCGFLTATELRQILAVLGHQEVAEAIGSGFSRTLRHPGESYIDYGALVESICSRKEQILEEDLWDQFKKFASDGAVGQRAADVTTTGRLPADRLGAFLQEADVRHMLAQDGVEDSTTLAEDILDLSLARPSSGEAAETAWAAPASVEQEVDFIELVSGVFRHLPPAIPAVEIVRC